VELNVILGELTLSKRSICGAMLFAMEYASSAREICKSIVFQINRATEPSRIIKWLYLISDILFNSSNSTVPAAVAYKREFEPLLC